MNFELNLILKKKKKKKEESLLNFEINLIQIKKPGTIIELQMKRFSQKKTQKNY